MGQKEEKEILLLRFLLQAVKMSGKLLITMKSGKILCHLCPLILFVPLRWRRNGGSETLQFLLISLFFPSLCAPVLVFVMGKEAVHGGNLNKKAHSMADYLKKVGY